MVFLAEYPAIDDKVQRHVQFLLTTKERLKGNEVSAMPDTKRLWGGLFLLVENYIMRRQKTLLRNNESHHRCNLALHKKRLDYFYRLSEIS